MVSRRHKAGNLLETGEGKPSMGQLQTFECESCGYSAEVSGGDDAGMVVTITTISCGVCRELYDVILWRVNEPELPPKEPQCPKAKPHPVSLWNYPGYFLFVSM